MHQLVALGRRFVKEDDGLAITEYGLLLALVAAALVVVIKNYKTTIGNWFTNSAAAVVAP
jgi:Flp pilus assembly pilin Flp